MPDGGRIAGQLVIPACIEVDLLWNLASGKQVKNVLHGSVAVGFVATAAVAQAIYAAIIGSGAWTAWAAFLHSTTAFAGVQMRDLRQANLPLVASTGAATAGTGAGLALPPGVALVITERTAQAGRGFRGRVYLPCLDSTVLVAGTGAVLATANAAAVAFMVEVESAMALSSMNHVIANPARQQYIGKRNLLHLARAAGVVPVTSVVARGIALTSQRRRSYVA